MFRNIYPCRQLWRSQSDHLRSAVAISNCLLIKDAKYLCSTSSEAKDNVNNQGIPIRVESQHTARDFPQPEQILREKSTRSTTCSEEVDKFRKLSSMWWDMDGAFKPLHSLNKLRVALVRDGLIQSGVSDLGCARGPQPLKGLRILDVGCGGGILCEPLARLGAEVTGLDPAQENISVAELHAQKDKKVASNVTYVQQTIEDHAAGLSAPYDAVVASEVVEHVISLHLFLQTCVDVTKPGGSLFITTLNKTTRSWLGAIVAAECLLGLLPRGTHDWDKFVPPKDLIFTLEKFGCSTSLVHGMFYVPFQNEWYWIPDSSVNYALHTVKRIQHPTSNI